MSVRMPQMEMELAVFVQRMRLLPQKEKGVLMKAYCKKCQKVTEFKCVKTTIKAGDNGFCQSESWCCAECNFAPLFKPDEIKD